MATKRKYPKHIGYRGSQGNIRSIHPLGPPESGCEARLDGVLVGHYPTQEIAERALQEALAARIKESKHG